MLMILGRKVSHWQFIFPPHLTSVFALPGETRTSKIATFYLNIPTNTQQLKTHPGDHVFTAKPLHSQSTMYTKPKLGREHSMILFVNKVHFTECKVN